MKKFVLKLDLEDASDKRRALKTVSTLSGIDEISIDIKAKKLTVIGTVDPVSVVSKLRKKNWPTHIISVGPAKEPEPPKKEEPKKEEPKKEEAKKEEPAKEEAKKEEPKKEEAKKEEPKKEEEKKAPAPAPEAQQMVLAANAMPYRPYYLPPQRPYYPPPPSYYYAHQSMEENPNACVIC